MLRGVFAISVAAACGSSTAPPPKPPISTTVAAPPPGPCEIGWLERADALSLTERSSGQFGSFQFRLELQAKAGELAGVMRAELQRRPGAKPRSLQLRVRFLRSQLAGPLAAMARAAEAPEDPGPPRGQLRSVGIGRSLSVAIDAAAQIRGVAHHARLQVSRGHEQPQPWLLGGCDRVLSRSAREQMAKGYARLVEILGRDRTLATLEASGS